MALNFGGQGTSKCEEQDLRLHGNVTSKQNKGQDLQFCRVCFGTQGNVYLMKMDKNLDQAYRILTGLSIQNEDHIPPYLCLECSNQVNQCFHFRNRSLRSHLLLLEILRKHDCITLESIKTLNEYQNTTNLDVAHNSIDQYNLETVSNIKKEIEYTDEQIVRNEPSLVKHLNHIDITKKEGEYLLGEESIIDEDNVPTLHEDLLADIKAENYDAYNDEDVNDGNTASDVYSDAFEGDYGADYNNSVGEQSFEVKLSVAKLKGITKTKAPIHLKQSSGDSLLYDKLCCDECSYKTDDDENLLCHLKTHTSTKSYKNQKLNSREKRISCNICTKTYINKFGLQKHMRTHNGEKPYTCDVCNKSFREKRDLQNHLRIHSGEKPYGCDICKKSFSERGNLLRHIRIHSGEKPFSCKFCKKSYNQKHHLKRHMTKHYKVSK